MTDKCEFCSREQSCARCLYVKPWESDVQYCTCGREFWISETAKKGDDVWEIHIYKPICCCQAQLWYQTYRAEIFPRKCRAKESRGERLFDVGKASVSFYGVFFGCGYFGLLGAWWTIPHVLALPFLSFLAYGVSIFFSDTRYDVEYKKYLKNHPMEFRHLE